MGRTRSRTITAPLRATVQSVGALVRGLREEHGWSQRTLAEKTGFSREYVAGVEWSGKGSVNFLKQAERVFGLEQGSLLKWPAYSAALLWCRRNKLRIADYIEMLRQAEAGFRPAPRSGPGGKIAPLTKCVGFRTLLTNMTLRRLLQPIGIKRYGDLARLVQSKGLVLTSQMCWLLWTGRSPAGAKSARAISKATGIPMEALLEVGRDGKARRARNG